jgi:hypothetical protein
MDEERRREVSERVRRERERKRTIHKGDVVKAAGFLMNPSKGLIIPQDGF